MTFLALGIFILIMYLLQRLFPPKSELEDTIGAQANPPPVEATSRRQQLTSMDGSAADTLAEATSCSPITVAAISVALCYWRREVAKQEVAYALEQSKIGETLTAGRGSWWVANRMNYQKKINLQRR